MEIIITDTAKEDIQFFLKSGQKGILKKIEKLLISIKDNPFSGIGKPQLLKHNYSGRWSRRIDSEHRIIYSVEDELVYIFSVRGHYKY
jgi:toxin YoeB